MLPMRIGGLLRCCIQTLNMRQPDDEADGATLECDYCDSRMIVRAGAWEWAAPESILTLRATNTNPPNGVG